jgi:hypothetical protein
MIYFSFDLSNPFSRRYGCVYEKLGILENHHKEYSIIIEKRSVIISFSFDLSIRQDHAGANLSFGVLGWHISFNISDTRHWNYTKGEWETYD